MAEVGQVSNTHQTLVTYEGAGYQRFVIHEGASSSAVSPPVVINGYLSLLWLSLRMMISLHTQSLWVAIVQLLGEKLSSTKYHHGSRPHAAADRTVLKNVLYSVLTFSSEPGTSSPV